MKSPRREHGSKHLVQGAKPRRNKGELPLEAVLKTAELARRPSRSPDFESENRALTALIHELANSPQHVLQKLVEVAMVLCRAQSAGVSLLEPGEQGEVFRWNAITGQLASHAGGTMPRECSPCNLVLERDTTLLFAYPERHFPYPAPIDPAMIEALLVPFHLHGKPIGTIWAIAHDESTKFDAEHARLLQDLANFASSAFEFLRQIEAFREEAAVRQQAERSLQESERRFRGMAENIPQIIWVDDSSGHITYISPKWTEYTGMPLERYKKGEWVRAVHPDDRERAAEDWRTAVANGTVYETEYRLRRVDGEYRWHLARAVPLCRGGNEKFWFGTLTDIETQKRTQNALIRSEKLASAGRMAATIAHEINNPLAAAINAVYLARTAKDVPADLAPVLALAEQELARASEITRQTLGFYREVSEPTSVGLAPLIGQILHIYQHKLRNKNIRIEQSVQDGITAFGIFGEIRQIVSNLITNAIEAVPANGTLWVRVSGPCPRKMVKITVADNGPGIAPENIFRIFEPFFTTKEAFGTGLGLWVTKELLEKQHGRIRVRSLPSKGTVFTVWLPADRPAHERTAA